MRATVSFVRRMLPFLLLCACSASERGELPVPPAGLLENPIEIAIGRQLFAAHCAECHGSIAEGRTARAARLNPPAPDFREQRYRRALPGYLYRRIEWGKKLEPFRSRGSVMPSWSPHLQPEKIWALVAYIRYRSGNLPASN